MTEVNAVSIKPPQFDPHRPAAYFAILEAQFHLSNITVENTKFYHCLSSLPTDIVSQLSATVLNDPTYSNLKKVLLSLHEASLPEKFAKLASSAQLSGRPSDYMKQLNSIAADLKIGDDIVRHRFISALPPSLQPVVAAQKSTPLDELSQLADNFMNLTATSSHPIAPVSQQHIAKRPPPLQQQQQLQSTPSGVQPFRSGQRPRVCRAHIYYGNRARSCRHWCEWPDKKQCTVTQSRSNTPHHSRSNSAERSENSPATV